MDFIGEGLQPVVERRCLLAESSELPREAQLAPPLQHGAGEGVEREHGRGERDHDDREHGKAERSDIGVLPDERYLPQVSEGQIQEVHQDERYSHECGVGQTECSKTDLPSHGVELMEVAAEHGAEQEERAENPHDGEHEGCVDDIGIYVVAGKVHCSVLSDSGSGWNSVELQLIW